MTFLANKEAKVEIVMQWIQWLVVDNMSCGVVAVAPPVASRVFQQLGTGVSLMMNAENLTSIPFPFCFSQVATYLLVLWSLFFALYAPKITDSYTEGAASMFFLASCMWSLAYLAGDLEAPFGHNANSLPLRELQHDMNQSLFTLIEPLARATPKFDVVNSRHGETTTIWQIDNGQCRLAHKHFKRESIVRVSRQGGRPSVSLARFDPDHQESPRTQINDAPAKIDSTPEGTSAQLRNISPHISLNNPPNELTHEPRQAADPVRHFMLQEQVPAESHHAVFPPKTPVHPTLPKHSLSDTSLRADIAFEHHAVSSKATPNEYL